MKIVQKLFALCLLLLLCTGISYSQLLPDDCNASGPLGQNLLNNPGFEANAAGLANAGGFQTAGGWNFFGAGWGNVYIDTPADNPGFPCFDNEPPPKLGTKVLKMFGQYTGSFSATGAFTNPIPAAPGETYVGGIHMLSPSAAECPN